MLKYLDQIDDKNFKMSFPEKEDKVLYSYLRDEKLEFQDQKITNFRSCIIGIRFSTLTLELVKDSLFPEEETIIQNLINFLRQYSVLNYIDYLIYKNNSIDNELFFK